MAATELELYERLIQCNWGQFAHIQVELQLPTPYLESKSTSERASAILQLLRQSRSKSWPGELASVLDKVQYGHGAEHYLGARLKDFVVEPLATENSSPDSVGTIRQLNEKLKEGLSIDKPILIRVKGTLFPAALLTEGWWERKRQSRDRDKIDWANPLQEWLFRGFDLWAPSWDICWGAVDPTQDTKRYYIAQLTEGDEADSLPVIIGTEKAKRLREAFRDSWGGFEAVVVGRLGHRHQFDEKLPPNVKRDRMDYYISVDDDNPRHRITRLNRATDLYSAYLWKLVAPQEWVDGKKLLGLNHVYFVWEHTNFVAESAIDYNLDGLTRKEEFITSKLHPGSKLVLLQKSHDIVPGEPTWSVEKFYHFYLGKGEEF